MTKKKRIRRTKAQIIEDKEKEERRKKREILKNKKSQSENIAEAIKVIANGVKKGEILSELVIKIQQEFNIQNVELVKSAAIEFIKDKVFKDHITFYANHIDRLEFLYKAAIEGKVKIFDDVMICNINYTEASKLLKQIEEARLTVYQIIQFQ